jgi:cell division septum initiation protein DivIVA
VLFTPQEIETRPFLTERQGYDRHEVQSFLKAVANEFRTLVERIEGLQEELAGAQAAVEAAEQRARAAEEARPEPAEAPIAAPAPAAPTGDPFVALGEEVAGVLRTAHDTAASITGAAEEAAADTKAKAAEDAERLRIEADAARRNAGEEAGRIVAEARREADELLNAELGRHDLLRHAGDELRQRLEDARAALGQILTQVESQPQADGQQQSNDQPQSNEPEHSGDDAGGESSPSDEYVG